MKRTLSILMAIVMLLTLIPAPAAVRAADGDVNIRIHYYSEPSWNWGAPAIQFWGGSNTTASEYVSGPTEISGWGGAQGYVMTPEGDGWYSIILTGDFTGFQFLDMNAPNDGNTAGKGYDPGMAQFTGSEPADLYCLYNGDTGYNTVWYLDKECTSPLSGSAEAKEYTYLVHYANPNGWSSVNAYAWNGSETLCGTWPGSAISQNADNAGWYDVTFTAAANSVGLIFNNGSAQTGDLTVAAQEDDDTLIEAWVDSAVSYAAPEGWVVDNTHDVTLHFLKPEGWGASTNAYLWHTGGAIPGYEAHNAWPGSPITENAEHPGWYNLTVTTDLTGFSFIFNDGMNQTADLSTGTIASDLEIWYANEVLYYQAPGEWTGDMEYTAHLHFQKPEGWGETVNAWIWDEGGALPGYEEYNTTWPGTAVAADPDNAGWYSISVTTKKETGFSFLFNDGTSQTSDLATGTLSAQTHLWVVDGAVLTTAPGGWMTANMTVHVPGTFPGPSWDAASNVMTYDEALGLYTYTFENVPPANYEYKIAINGSWTENYGAGGVRDGANIAVTVPETMDVTVYYNHTTHNSVTNVTYVFADITLSGTGIPEGTKLSDPGLTGIYSAAVWMESGTYTDVKLTYNGQDYAFSAIELTQSKDVTFFFDPATGIFYHNGSDVPMDTASIFYDSQDEGFKSPYGAVATGETVTFSIATGTDAVAAALVVKGSQTVQLAKDGEPEGGMQRWSGTAVFDAIGEYDYYFSVSNGSSVVIYGDDDGYYGSGTVTDLGGVMPYDLVVYQAGFETPDWMKNAVIYQIFPDRFYDGNSYNNLAQTSARGAVDYEYIPDWYTLPENPDQEKLLTEEAYKATGAHWGDGEWSNEIYGGDLEGIIERIDYLKALGVNVIYLNPIFASISSHRYDTSDYMLIDPILGTMGDFTRLVEVAEENGMHIILDGVFNHVSDDSIYFDRYYKYLGTSEKVGAYPYWAYVYDHMAETGSTQEAAEAAARVHFETTYGVTDFAYTEWFEVYNSPMEGAVDSIGLRAGKSVYSYDGWWGYDSMPIIYSTGGSEYRTGDWAEEIIYNEDGTSVTQYWLSEGNNGWRLDVANEVSDETWQKFRESVKALDSDAVIIGEIWDDATKYLLGDMYDSVMNYQFRNIVTSFVMENSDSSTAAKALERIRERYPEEAFYAMMNLVGSHDTTRIYSYLSGVPDDRSDTSLEAAFPTWETSDPNAAQMQQDVATIQFTYPGAPTVYYGDETSLPGADDPDDRRAFPWGQGYDRMVKHYAKLAAIRETYPALRTGSIEMVDTGSADLLGYWRSDESMDILVLINRSNAYGDTDSISYTMPESRTGVWVNALDGNRYDLSESRELSCSNSVNMILVPESRYVAVTVDEEALSPAWDPDYEIEERPITGIIFTDVDDDTWFADDVYTAANLGLFEGVGDGLFMPGGKLNRAQLVTILWRYAGQPAPENAPSFVDVPEGQFYSEATAWASENGIVNGVGANRFDPNGTVTREQAVTMFHRFCTWLGEDTSDRSDLRHYGDADSVTYWAVDAFSWAVYHGVIEGSDDGGQLWLSPQRSINRAEAATILVRLHNVLN